MNLLIAALKHVVADEKSDAVQRQKARTALRGLRDHITRYKKDIQEAADLKFEASRQEIKSFPFFWNQGNLIIPFGAVDEEYEDLWVILTYESGNNGLGTNNSFPGKQFMRLSGLKGPFDPHNLATRIRQPSFIHEFIHYLDITQHPIGNSAKALDAGDITKYFNDPSEYNAYYQEALEAVENILSNDTFAKVFENQTADEFIKYVKDRIANDQFVKFLEPKYERKLDKRLARFYTEVLLPRLKEIG